MIFKVYNKLFPLRFLQDVLFWYIGRVSAQEQDCAAHMVFKLYEFNHETKPFCCVAKRANNASNLPKQGHFPMIKFLNPRALRIF